MVAIVSLISNNLFLFDIFWYLLVRWTAHTSPLSCFTESRFFGGCTWTTGLDIVGVPEVWTGKIDDTWKCANPACLKKKKKKKICLAPNEATPPPKKTMVCNFKNFSSISRYHFIENGPLWAASTSLKTSTKPYASFHLKYCLITVKTVHLQSSLKCLTTSWIYQLAYTVIITGKINLPTLLQAAHLWKYPYVF